MGKRVLVVATVASHIYQFHMESIKILQDMGYSVDVAADFTCSSMWSEDSIIDFKKNLTENNIGVVQICFSRNPFRFDRHFQAYQEILQLLNRCQYSFVHSNTPIASAIIRLAAKKTGISVIYTAHGFHFYNGAPFINWLIYYPIERYLSRYTNVLITINKEDFDRANAEFKAKKVVYVPGVGVDTERFAPSKCARERIRSEFGISDDRIVLFSVGELNANKNHESVIKALRSIDNVTYVIAGSGHLASKLKRIAKKCDVDLRLLGYRDDVENFYSAADIYILPSLREGLNVSLMEAMVASLPCLAGKIRGNVDLLDEAQGGFLFVPTSINDIRSVIIKMLTITSKERVDMGYHNLRKISSFGLQSIREKLSEIYSCE